MKKYNFNVFYFLLIFFILYYGFYFYIGLSTPGGKVFIPFLYHYLNIPYWLSIVVIKMSVLLLKILGYGVYQKSAVNITIVGSRGANVSWGCLGAGVMTLWLAFVASHKAKGSYKFKWVLLGIALIFFFNALRIVSILLCYYYNWYYFQSFNAHKTFNYFTYVIIMLLALVFVRNYNRSEGRRFDIN